ncbi:MAG TPA: hypothetical protein G4O07_04445 [Dehalococcoidia bacterium]|nr:hypothetical protein [Dehalococcoidia bacterium]
MLNKILQSSRVHTVFFLSSAIFVGLFSVILKDTGMDALSIVTSVFLAMAIVSGLITCSQGQRQGGN